VGDQSGKKKAKWVDITERKRRQEKGLYFRYGASGHRILKCPYAPPTYPTAINAIAIKPLLEDEEEGPDAAESRAGKE